MSGVRSFPPVLWVFLEEATEDAGEGDDQAMAGARGRGEGRSQGESQGGIGCGVKSMELVRVKAGRMQSIQGLISQGL